MAFEEFIGIRIEKELRARFLRLARQPEHRRHSETILYRMALDSFIESEERRLELKPITDRETGQLIDLIIAERGRPAEPPVRRPRATVSYRKRKSFPKG